MDQKLSKSKLVGGILLIVGTSIGGGMLALPVSTAQAGITNSIVFLTLCWLVMTAGALLVLEVNLRLPAGSNMISMAKATLGLPGQIIAWITYLLLLYTLVAAYISGGSDVFSALLDKVNINTPAWFMPGVLTIVFSLIIYKGITAVDYVNRGLMLGKIGIYLLLVFLILPHVNVISWSGGSLPAIPGTLMLLITSFGFATLVPSLREYFNDDVKTLRKAIIFGSFIPLVCYILWEAVVMGVIQRDGSNGLIALMTSEHATSGLTQALNAALNSKLITGFFSFFTSICMLTAFLGVSLGLFDFLADGLNLKRKDKQGKIVLCLTFLPPLAIVLLSPGIFIQALSYAGILCVILLLFLPTLMAWQGRKQTTDNGLIFIPGGRFSLILIGSISIFLLILSLSN